MAKRKPKAKCTVRDGRFTEPCDALQALIDGRLIRHQHFTHMPSGEATRSIVTLHSGEWKKNGMAINCCPLCGERIDAPHHYRREAA